MRFICCNSFLGLPDLSQGRAKTYGHRRKRVSPRIRERTADFRPCGHASVAAGWHRRPFMPRAEFADFVAAQDRVWQQVEAELAAGAKRSHWMWFVFPQIAGLGRSETARYFALGSAAEARAYLDHPVLGPRLRHGVALMLRHESLTAEAILGGVDAAKFRSCLTLFAAVAPEEPLFARALAAFYDGPDQSTRDLLRR
jgi:uncharacterized protein (DUF1810 family)